VLVGGQINNLAYLSLAVSQSKHSRAIVETKLPELYMINRLGQSGDQHGSVKSLLTRTHANEPLPSSSVDFISSLSHSMAH